MELNFSDDFPPLAAIAAAKIAGVSLTTNSTLAPGSTPTLALSNGQRLQGAYTLLKYVGRTASIPGFYERDAYQSCQIDEWLDYAPIFGSGSEFEGACSSVDEFSYFSNVLYFSTDVLIIFSMLMSKHPWRKSKHKMPLVI